MFLLHFFLISLSRSSMECPVQTPAAYPLSVSTRLMNITGNTICDSLGPICQHDNFDKPSTYSCGQICWSDNGNATFSYTFKGIQFLIYGRHNKAGKFNLFVDNKYLGEIIERKSDEKVAALLYTSDVYDYGEHTIQAVGQPDHYFEVYKFAFWPEKQVKRLNISEMSATGKWIKESDEIGGTREYSEKSLYARKSSTIEASKLWIYGTNAPHHGKLLIKYNKISQIVETDSTPQECRLLFESEKIDFTRDTLDLIAIENKSVLINCIYYLYDPPVQIKSHYPLDTIHRNSNLDFIDKKFTKDLPENKQIYIKSNSEITQISGCTFTNIELSSIYFIRLAKEVSFFENNFEFSILGDNPAPIYLDNEFQGSLTISQCIFDKCVARENNGNVLYCDSDVNFTFENCKFINCGNNGSQMIVKSRSNIGYLANFTNCIFLFDIDSFSCYAYAADYSQNVLFDHCEFSKCRVVNITHKIDSFEFTNNVVTSSSQQIIFINNLEHKLIISFNFFQNSILNDTNFITLIHNINEIELFNNTFSDFIAVNHGNHSFIYLQRYKHIKSYLIFNECKFRNIQNDYSAFQIGFSFFTANVAIDFINCEFFNNTCTKGKGGALSVGIEHELLISKCTFKNNKAAYHGGALVLYNITNVEINSCTFEENTANFFLSSSQIPFNTKQKGRGGAIYINMHHTVNNSVRIEYCKFIKNSAFDGYAIYFAGDDDLGKFSINFNFFIDNYDKNSNLREKGMITSVIYGLNENKILNSNLFTSEGNNILHPLKYTKHKKNAHIQNSLIYKFKFENFTYFHFILILFILISIIILMIYMTRNYMNNTFIFVILGDSALEYKESSNELIVSKCTNYCFPSYALLIKRLAIKHLGINEQHICILGKGEVLDFDISTILPDNKILIQLTIDEIYTTKYFNSELKLNKFRNISTLITAIESFLEPFKCKKPNIIVFLYDHGDENKFGELNHLDLYLKLSSIPHSSLQIYNESCKSNSMLITLKNYFTISEVINSFWSKITQKELYFLQSVAKKIYIENSPNQWDLISSLDYKYYNYFSNIDNIKSFKVISTSEDYLVIREKIVNEDFYSHFTQDEIKNLIEIINCYKSEYAIYPQNYKEIHHIFEKGIEVVKKILYNLHCTSAEFIEILDSFRDNVSNTADINFQMHQNHSIVTSSHQTGLSPTFGTIRVNKYIKIIAGSPAMGAYIIEALMNRSMGKNSIKNIKKRVNGNYKDLIMEYATQSNIKGKKKWNRLFINYWESNSFSKEKIFLNQNTNNAEFAIKDIMRSVDFHLCDSCCIEFKDNYCITKKMQPLLKKENCKKINVIGLRLSDLNQKYDFKENYIENDDYYSDDDNNNQTNTLDSPKSSNIVASTSFEEFFDNFDFDMIIPSEYVLKITQDIPILNSVIFPLRFFEVFKYELKKICESSKFNIKYPLKSNETDKIAPERFKCKLRNWIMYFFPTYTIISEIDDLMNLFYAFTINYDISEENYKIIFYKCMNVADQVASQLSHVDKKTAYYTSRLKNNSHDVDIN